MAKNEKRTFKEITKKEDIDYLLNIKEEDVTLSFMMETFGEFEGKNRFNSYDVVTIPANSYGPKDNRNIEPFRTTVGQWVFNKVFIENELFDIFRYYEDTINKKNYGAINKKLTYAVLEDDISLKTLKNFLIKTEKFMPFVSILSTSLSLKMLLSTKVINKKKKELLDKYKKELAAGDEVISEQIEKELLNFARDYLMEDPSMDYFDSGARGSFANNFKNMFIMKGAIKDPDPDAEVPYRIAKSNYMEGISPDEYSLFANSLAAGPYARSKKTSEGGYLEKLFTAAFQHITLDEAGSDCGTTHYVETILDNPDPWMYSYIIEGNNLIELTSKNVNKYLGKKVKFRYSSMCNSNTGICNKCAGNMFYRIGITNIGTATAISASTLKNLAMKSFHDSSVKTTEMDPMKAFGLSN